MSEAGDLSLEDVVDDFLEAAQRGESPSIDDYVRRYPDLESDLRRALQLVAWMEQVGGSSVGDQGPPARLPPPDRIGEYRVIREIGRGGMGVVYEAEQESLGRRVALKVLPERHAQQGSALERFHREARAAAKMHHTNIVPVFEVGYENGSVFYAMQLIDGSGLDEVVDEWALAREFASNNPSKAGADTKADAGVEAGAVTKADASLTVTPSLPDLRERCRIVARIGTQAADALAYAHARGVIHRDVKPSNLLMDEYGIVWMTDFGLAKTDAEAITEPGDFVGTLRYMSPERFQGHCDERADTYSLGLTLYELLVLRPAFACDDRLKLMELISTAEPERPKSIDAGIPRELETIVLKSIDRDPKHRYQTAEELGADLRRFLDDKPVLARRASPVERIWRWTRREPRLAAAIVTVAVLITSFSLVATWAAFREAGLRRLAESSQREIRQNLYYAHVNLASQSVNEPGGVAVVRELTRQWLPAPREEDLRGWEWYYLNACAHSERLTIKAHQAEAWSVAWSPDGTRLVSAGNDATLRFWNAKTGELIRSVRTVVERSVDWSPNGKWIVSGGFRGEVEIRDAESGQLIRSFTADAGDVVNCIRWSPDSTRIAATIRHGGAVIWDAEGRVAARLFKSNGALSRIVWSPDGTQVVTANHNRGLRIWHAHDGRQINSRDGHRSAVGPASWSPDGKWIASGERDASITCWNANSGGLLRTLRTSGVGIAALGWSPDSRRLAAAAGDLAIRVWDLESQIPNPSFELRGHSDQILELRWNPTAPLLATCSTDGDVKVWDLNGRIATRAYHPQRLARVADLDVAPDGTRVVSATDGGRIEIRDANGAKLQVLDDGARIGGDLQVLRVRWSHDGSRIASADHAGTVRIWDVEQNRLVQTLTCHDRRVWSVSWSPDSQRVASASEDGTIKIWDPRTGRRVHTLKGHHSSVRTADWSSDGRSLATGERLGTVLVWDTKTWEVRHKLEEHEAPVICVRWDPSGERLATGGRDLKVVLWDLSMTEPSSEVLKSTSSVTSIDWSRHLDRPRLVAAGKNGILKIWDLSTGRLTVSLRGHKGTISNVRWMHDDQRMVSSGWDGAIRIWDAGDVPSDRGKAVP